MNEILPGLTPAGASLLLSLAQRGLQAIQADAQAAGSALDVAITAANQQAQAPTQEKPE